MGEKLAVLRTSKPFTITRLKAEFIKAGLKKGDTIIFHSAMGQAKWICGGAIAVIAALEEVITPCGNIVMAAQTGGLSDPSSWENPPVPKSWWEEIRLEMPVFDKERTPCHHMGVIAETFRSLPDVMRSNHPYLSVTAWGKDAEYITENHPLDHGLGEKSPIGKLYQMKDSKVVLFGVDNDANTSLHLAEERASTIPNRKNQAYFIENGKRVLKQFEEAHYDSERFIAIGKAYEQQKGNCTTNLAGAGAKIYPLKDLVDFGTHYLNQPSFTDIS
ncbi:aminoglycoside N(3)-acetyltransferase [Listeria sp. PSOL-1]|uniref:aminoglycoside N(3)-acetyltransferase n=1 Tax=Listeria sp. PSOL-1 TaxID=1844999 RepID=UPI0013CF5011|nr:AAC(3) family N-acetyltransferase [Listeria sp. PSOL-1]